MKEYQVVNFVDDPNDSSSVSASRMQILLNQQAMQGWELKQAVSTRVNNLLLIFERNQKSA
jgi:hypothetical protein